MILYFTPYAKPTQFLAAHGIRLLSRIVQKEIYKCFIDHQRQQMGGDTLVCEYMLSMIVSNQKSSIGVLFDSSFPMNLIGYMEEVLVLHQILPLYNEGIPKISMSNSRNVQRLYASHLEHIGDTEYPFSKSISHIHKLLTCR